MARTAFIIPVAIGTMVISAWLSPLSQAQSFWLDQRGEKLVSIELLKPRLDGGGTTLASSAVFFAGRFPIGQGISVAAELPLSHFGYESSFASESHTAVGNPYVGLRMRSSSSPWQAAFGVRLPLASDENPGLITGLNADFDRFEAFTPELSAIQFDVNYLFEHPSGFSTSVRAAPSIMIPARESGGDTELFIAYSAMGWQRHGRVRAGAGMSGRLLASQPGLSIEERSVHQLGLSVIGTFGSVQPGLHFRLPVDEEFSRFVDYVIGMNVAVLLK